MDKTSNYFNSELSESIGIDKQQINLKGIQDVTDSIHDFQDYNLDSTKQISFKQETTT